MTITELWETLIKLNHRMTREQYQDLQVNGKISIKLDRNEVNLLQARFGKNFNFTENSISIK